MTLKVPKKTHILVQDNLTQEKIDSLIKNHTYVITDIIDYAEILNREKLMQSLKTKFLFKDSYSKSVLFQYDGLFVETPVYKVVQ